MTDKAMVEPLDTKAMDAAVSRLEELTAMKSIPSILTRSGREFLAEKAVVAYLSASPSLPVVDGGELVERLAYRVGNPSAWPEGFDQKASDLFRSAVALISSQKQEIERLREALKPFARIADMEEKAAPAASVTVNVNRCRDARAALEDNGNG